MKPGDVLSLADDLPVVVYVKTEKKAASLDAFFFTLLAFIRQKRRRRRIKSDELPVQNGPVSH